MLYENTPKLYQNTIWGKEIQENISKRSAVVNGKMAPNFTVKDLSQHNLSLKSFRGKYVILNFWGSWCVPCRQSHPNLIRLYKEYHPKGLEIIGIANSEKNDSTWVTAIKKDAIDIWYHVRDKDDIVSDISESFAISFLPTNILIDPKGVIIGRYVSDDEALEEKLKTITF
ncbi:TlpA family protein disulfide reductase [Zhouia sp. PK063]|uniref:TlpA family protein disulfide reductase n=1 Tax=Zhouia sp. PK063 TaxID=3373602 RepID=UPI0037950ADC